MNYTNTYTHYKANIHSTLISLMQVVGGSLLIALCARIKIPLPFTPVPITGQTLAVLLLGVSLGSRKGAACVLAYFAEIALGMPVLNGGFSNPLAFFGIHCGYLLGMPLQAYLAGKLSEQPRYSAIRSTLYLGAACIAQLTMGACGLINYVGLENAFLMGVCPFIPGETIKAFIVTNYLRSRQVNP